MAKEFSDRAIVLRVRGFKDTDVVVKFISSNHGILTCFAFGGKKSRRRFPGCLEELNYVIFNVRSPRMGNYLFLEEGILLDRFPNLQLSPSILGMAKNCQKFLESLGEHQPHPGIFDVFLQLLRTLNQKKINLSSYFPIFFRARIAREMGWFPEIDSCNGCGRLLKAEAYVRFHPIRGQIYCRECENKGAILFSHKIHKRMKNIFFSGPCRWSEPRLTSEEEGTLTRALDLFIKWNVRVIWDRGRFVHI